MTKRHSFIHLQMHILVDRQLQPTFDYIECEYQHNKNPSNHTLISNIAPKLRYLAYHQHCIS